jgi:hypothetical protein
VARRHRQTRSNSPVTTIEVARGTTILFHSESPRFTQGTIRLTGTVEVDTSLRFNIFCSILFFCTSDAPARCSDNFLLYEVPDFAFHPMGFDLNGAWGPSALHILDFTAALSSHATTKPQARIKRRSIQAISGTISQMNASLIRARQPLPFPNLVQYGP